MPSALVQLKKKQPNGAECCKLHSKLLNYIHGNPLTLSQCLNFLSFFKTYIKVAAILEVIFYIGLMTC